MLPYTAFAWAAGSFSWIVELQIARHLTVHAHQGAGGVEDVRARRIAPGVLGLDRPARTRIGLHVDRDQRVHRTVSGCSLTLLTEVERKRPSMREAVRAFWNSSIASRGRVIN